MYPVIFNEHPQCACKREKGFHIQATFERALFNILVRLIRREIANLAYKIKHPYFDGKQRHIVGYAHLSRSTAKLFEISILFSSVICLVSLGCSKSFDYTFTLSSARLYSGALPEKEANQPGVNIPVKELFSSFEHLKLSALGDRATIAQTRAKLMKMTGEKKCDCTCTALQKKKKAGCHYYYLYESRASSFRATLQQNYEEYANLVITIFTLLCKTVSNNWVALQGYIFLVVATRQIIRNFSTLESWKYFEIIIPFCIYYIELL